MAQFVLKPETVQGCMWNIVDARVHRHFPGYLCVKRLAKRDGTTSRLPFQYDAFFDTFFKIRDYADPYFVPFGSRHTQVEDLWFNGNVAGTYSSKSIRPDQPFDRVVNVEKPGSNNLASLRDNHWEKAREHLTGSEKVPVTDVAAFLYRDFSIEPTDGEEPSGDHLVQVFREEFGFEEGIDNEAEQFDTLFENDTIEITNENFEQL